MQKIREIAKKIIIIQIVLAFMATSMLTVFADSKTSQYRDILKGYGQDSEFGDLIDSLDDRTLEFILNQPDPLYVEPGVGIYVDDKHTIKDSIDDIINLSYYQEYIKTWEDKYLNQSNSSIDIDEAYYKICSHVIEPYIDSTKGSKIPSATRFFLWGDMKSDLKSFSKWANPFIFQCNGGVIEKVRDTYVAGLINNIAEGNGLEYKLKLSSALKGIGRQEITNAIKHFKKSSNPDTQKTAYFMDVAFSTYCAATTTGAVTGPVAFVMLPIKLIDTAADYSTRPDLRLQFLSYYYFSEVMSPEAFFDMFSYNMDRDDVEKYLKDSNYKGIKIIDPVKLFWSKSYGEFNSESPLTQNFANQLANKAVAGKKLMWRNKEITEEYGKAVNLKFIKAVDLEATKQNLAEYVYNSYLSPQNKCFINTSESSNGTTVKLNNDIIGVLKQQQNLLNVSVSWKWVNNKGDYSIIDDSYYKTGLVNKQQLYDLPAGTNIDNNSPVTGVTYDASKLKHDGSIQVEATYMDSDSKKTIKVGRVPFVYQPKINSASLVSSTGESNIEKIKLKLNYTGEPFRKISVYDAETDQVIYWDESSTYTEGGTIPVISGDYSKEIEFTPGIFGKNSYYVKVDGINTNTVTINCIDPNDLDQDGLCDEWENVYFTGVYGNDYLSKCQPSGDPDGDGKTNLVEYMENTHPCIAGIDEIMNTFDISGLDGPMNMDGKVKSNLLINGGNIDLNGHRLVVEGNVDIYYGTVNLNGGTLLVKGKLNIHGGGDIDTNKGTLTVEGKTEISGGILKASNGIVNIQGDFVQSSGVVDLNGGKMEIKGKYNLNGGSFNSDKGKCKITGDLIQASGELTVGGGSIEVGGDYRLLQSDNTKLKMIEEKDYIKICKSFVNQSNTPTDYLTNGVLEVQGDFTSNRLSWDLGANFKTSGNHKIILSGTTKQNVQYDNPSYSTINCLEITNTSTEGVEFKTNVYITGVLKPVKNASTKIINSKNILMTEKAVVEGVWNYDLSSTGKWELQSGVKIKGNMFVRGDINVNGFEFNTGSDLIQENGMLTVGGGKVEVGGDYRLLQSDNTKLKMINEKDHIKVCKSFVYQGDTPADYLTNGVLEVQGDFTSNRLSWSLGANFKTSGNHKIILSGTTKQNVQYEIPQASTINCLEITNTSTEGVEFKTNVYITGVLKPVKNTTKIINSKNILVTEEAVVEGVWNYDLGSTGEWVLKSGLEMKGNMFVEGGKWVLQSGVKITGNMFVKGDININGFALNISGDLTQASGVLTVGGGSIEVGGDYRMQTVGTDKDGNVTYGDSSAKLEMKNEKDYVKVGKSFINKAKTPNDYLTNGVLEVQGDFISYQRNDSSEANFKTSGNHKIVLSGTTKQNVQYDNPSYSTINCLEIINTSTEGVEFKSPIVVTMLFDHNRKTFTIVEKSVFPDYDKDGLNDNEDTYPKIPNSLTNITVTPSNIAIDIGEQQSIKVIALYSDGTSKQTTTDIIFNTSNPKVATVDNNGLVSAVGSGNALITITYGPKSSTVSVNVNSIGYTVSGYIEPDIKYSAENASKIKSNFKVEFVGTKLTALTDENGYFEIKGVPNGNYSIKISKNNCLSRTINNISIIKDSTIFLKDSPFILWAGDIEIKGVQDECINMLDVIEIAKGFNTTTNDTNYIANADLNMDGSINMSDILILARHFNSTPLNY